MSVSEALDLVECGYRLAFAWDPAVDRALSSAAAALGSLVHAVAEWVGKGGLVGVQPQEARDTVDARWREEEQRVYAQLCEQWAPAEPPEPEAWPGFHLTKERMLRRAIRLTGLPLRARGKATVESSVEDAELGLRGRIDRVDDRGGRLWIVDLKTGIRQAEVTHRQRRQLLLYAALVGKQLGRVVHGIAIEHTSGDQQTEELDSAAVEEAVAAFKTAREVWRTHARAGRLRATAVPSADTCRWCPHRSECEPYWHELAEEWHEGSMQGIVASTSTTPPSVTISIERPRDAASEDWTVSGAAPHLKVEEGARVRIVDARPTAKRHAFRAEWSTRATPIE